jgi:hypothetical protein
MEVGQIIERENYNVETGEVTIEKYIVTKVYENGAYEMVPYVEEIPEGETAVKE